MDSMNSAGASVRDGDSRDVLTEEERDSIFANIERNERLWPVTIIFLVVAFIADAIRKRHPETAYLMKPIWIGSLLVWLGLSFFGIRAMHSCPRCKKIHDRPWAGNYWRWSGFPAQCSRCGVNFFPDRLGKAWQDIRNMISARRVRKAK